MNNPKIWGEVCLKVLAPALVALGGILLTIENDNNDDSQE